MKTKNKHLLTNLLSGLLGLLVILLVGAAIWFYKTPFGNTKTTFAKWLPFPVALVGDHGIFAGQLAARLAVAKNFYSSGGEPDPEQLYDQVFSELIAEKQAKIVAQKAGLPVSAEELNDALRLQKNANNDINAFFSQYKLSENDFKNQILEPAVLEDDLRVWFNGQRALNDTAYKKADGLMQQLKDGAAFDSLAQHNSEDPASAQLLGDEGYISDKNLLFEFREPVDAASVGSVILVPSRLGLHILKIEDKDTKVPDGESRVHLRQIFIRTSDFDSWLSSQTKNLNAKILINY